MSNPRLSSALKRKSPAQRALLQAQAFGAGLFRFLRKDWISTLLLISALALIFTFFSLLRSLSADSTGTETSLTQVQRLATDRKIDAATLLDRDHRVQVTTVDGQQLYADYPGSDSATQGLLNTLNRGGADVRTDPQADKPLRSRWRSSCCRS